MRKIKDGVYRVRGFLRRRADPAVSQEALHGYPFLGARLDLFTNIIMSNLNGPLFQQFLGGLNGTGQASATLWLPPIPGNAGLTMSFAYALNNPYNFVSNPINVLITP